MSLTRRALITIGAATALAPVITGTHPAIAAQPTGRAQEPVLVSVRRVGTTSSIFGANHRSVVVFEELRALTITGPVAALSGGSVVIRYDARVSILSGRSSIVQVGSATHVIPVTVDAEPGVFRLQLPTVSKVPPGGMVVSVPLRRSAVFPTDGVDAPARTTAEVLSPAGVVLTRSTPAVATPEAGTAWGAQLAAVWQPVTLRGNDQYAVPAVLRVSSVGPGPIPAGTRLRVAVDSRLVRITGLDVLDTTGTTPRAATVTTHSDGSSITLTTPIPAGDAVTITAAVAANAMRTLPADVRFATVSLAASSGAASWQRITGTETITPLSASGQPRTPDAFTGRI